MQNTAEPIQSSLPANESRGEVSVTVDGVPLVVAVEMQRLAFISSALGCKTLPDLYERIAGAELSAMFACLDQCVIRGDAKKAKAKASFAGFQALSEAMLQAMTHHMGDSPGKPEAGENPTD